MRWPCIVCGGYNDGNHKCDPDYIRRVEAGYKSAEDPEPRRPSEGERLYEGLMILFGE